MLAAAVVLVFLYYCCCEFVVGLDVIFLSLLPLILMLSFLPADDQLAEVRLEKVFFLVVFLVVIYFRILSSMNTPLVAVLVTPVVFVGVVENESESESDCLERKMKVKVKGTVSAVVFVFERGRGCHRRTVLMTVKVSAVALVSSVL